MNQANLQNSPSSMQVATGAFSRLAARGIGFIHNLLACWIERHNQEADIERAIEHLHRLTDEQLRDMGITRDDINHVVRYGKQENV